MYSLPPFLFATVIDNQNPDATSGDLTVESSGNIALEGGDIALN